MIGSPTEIGIDVSKEKLKSALIPAEVLDFRPTTFDASKARIKELVASSAFTVVDVGPGFRPPNISIDQNPGDLWIGADVALGYDANQTVARGSRDIDPDANRVIVPGEVEVLPPFTADLIMMIAPNPRNIVEDDLLGQLDKFVGIGTKLFLKLDNRTAEAKSYGAEAKSKIREFLRENGFVGDEMEGLGDRLIDTSSSKDAVGGVVFKAKKVR